MFEVHNSIKPGRPRLLLALSLFSLAGALGLAWSDVLRSRRLGPPIELGPELIVRVPAGWAPAANDPRLFQPANSAGPPGAAGRRVQFSYQDLGEFVSPLVLARRWPWVGEGPQQSAAMIGRLPAIQFYQPTVRISRGGEAFQVPERLLRIACTPDGRVVTVEYSPQLEATRADFELFEEICAAVEAPGAGPALDPVKALSGAGFELPLTAEHALFARSAPAGVRLSVMASPDGLPSWSAELSRSWLAFGREPADLLADFGARAWRTPAADLLERVERWSRKDGADCALLRRPRTAATSDVSAALVVSLAPDATALVVARTDPLLARQAEGGLIKLMNGLVVRSNGAPFALEDAVTAGEKLAGALHEGSAPAWWFPGTTQTFYVGQVGDGVVGRVRARDSVSLGKDTFRGWIATASERVGDIEWERWTWRAVDGRYEHVRGMGASARPGALGRIEVELSGPDPGVIERFVEERGHRSAESRFTIGPAFVAPPLEEVAEAVAAHQERGDWLIEVTSRPGLASHARWLRPLPARDGLHRVLVTDDYWPVAVELTLDADGERHVDYADGVALRRILSSELGAYRRVFERLIELLRE